MSDRAESRVDQVSAKVLPAIFDTSAEEAVVKRLDRIEGVGSQKDGTPVSQNLAPRRSLLI